MINRSVVATNLLIRSGTFAGNKRSEKTLYNAYERINTRKNLGGRLSKERATALFVVIPIG